MVIQCDVMGYTFFLWHPIRNENPEITRLGPGPTIPKWLVFSGLGFQPIRGIGHEDRKPEKRCCLEQTQRVTRAAELGIE